LFWLVAEVAVPKVAVRVRVRANAAAVANQGGIIFTVMSLSSKWLLLPVRRNDITNNMYSGEYLRSNK
jgi:hypothetical protein